MDNQDFCAVLVHNSPLNWAANVEEMNQAFELQTVHVRTTSLVY